MLDLAKLATLTKALVFVALAAAVTILLQSDRLNNQYHSLGSEKFGSPKLLYLFPGSKTVALEPLGSWTREHPGVGDLSVCASFAPLRNDSRALPLLDLWLQDVSSGIETYMEERASDQDVISEWSVLDKHFGHALRRIWETHGTPIFSFWIKQVNVLVAKREGWQYWWDADNQQGTKLSFEEHGFGEWLGKQSMDHRRLSKMERYHEYYDKLGREEDDQFLADASMLCALAQLQIEEQYLTTWQDRNQWMQKPEAMQRLSDAERFMVNIGNNVNKVKYDDIIHAFVWSHLRFMKRKEEDLGPVLSYLGSLCKILPTNEAYMACGHGIGHGINFFSAIEDLPSSAVFNLTQLEAFDFGSVTSMFHEEGRLYEEANAEERNQLAFALLLFGCNHFAPSMSMLPEDLVYVDYASSSCQTGFYHQLFTKATFNVVMAFDSTSEDKVLSSEINSYWNEHLLETCTSMADAYLEALWNHYKNGTKSKLEASLRTTATACFYNRAYFQMEYNNHIIEAYSFVNNHAVSCSKIGRRKCEELCKNEKGLGLHEIKGHNYPFAAMKCMNACLQLATDNVQPLCWSGVGTNLAVLAKDCTMFAVRHHEKVTQEAMPGEEPEKIHLEFMSAHISMLHECLLLCTAHSQKECSRAAWEHCVLGYLQLSAPTFMGFRDNALFICDHLIDDPFMYERCKVILTGMVPSTLVKVPISGAFILDVESDKRLMNQTVPKLKEVNSLPSKSRVLRCILIDDSKCHCHKLNRYIPIRESETETETETERERDRHRETDREA